MRKKSQIKIAQAAILIAVLVVFDQITKILAQAALKGKDAFILIPDVFELRYLENTSAAFGKDPVSILNQIFHFSYFVEHPEALLAWKMGFFALFTIAAVVIIVLIDLKIPDNRRFLWIDVVLQLFIAGAIGNFIDRMGRHYVIDFFYFSLIDFPIFNVADIYVTVGAVLLIVLVLFYYKEEDFEAVFPSKNKANKDSDRN